MPNVPRRNPSISPEAHMIPRRQFLTRSAQLVAGTAALLALGDTLIAPRTVSGATASVTPPVPAQYVALAAELKARMNTEVAYLRAATPRPPINHTYAAALYTADPNRGTGLLNPYAMSMIVAELDSLQALGLKAVEVSLSYPLLDPSFPNHAGYLAFYTQVVAEVKRRGMTLGIKNGIFAAPDSVFDYHNLTVDSFFAGRTTQAQVIARTMAPDYLTLGAEPTSDLYITGLKYDVARYTQFINQTLASVPRGKVQYCAGAGAWNDQPYWDSLMANTSLDQGDIHIYPLASTSTDFFQLAARMADTAHTHGKGVIISECSLYKASAVEVENILPHTTVYGRDIYDFWQPFDSQFLLLMQQFCQVKGVKLMSYFWSKYLHQSYVPYTSITRNYTFDQGTSATTKACMASINAHTYSTTGGTYSQIVKGA